MEKFSLPIVITIVALFIACIMSITAMYYRSKAKKKGNEIVLALEKLAIAHTEMQALQQRYQDSLEFQKSLNEAEITTRLQQPRLSNQHGHKDSAPPERYRYVRSLAESGMSAEEISSVLSISTQEAEQLVNLSKLANISS